MVINDESIKKKTVKLDLTDPHASVYLRVISPTEIEYVIALPEQVASNNYLSSIQSIQL